VPVQLWRGGKINKQLFSSFDYHRKYFASLVTVSPMLVNKTCALTAAALRPWALASAATMN
jgi:hypothetical protein